MQAQPFAQPRADETGGTRDENLADRHASTHGCAMRVRMAYAFSMSARPFTAVSASTNGCRRVCTEVKKSSSWMRNGLAAAVVLTNSIPSRLRTRTFGWVTGNSTAAANPFHIQLEDFLTS